MGGLIPAQSTERFIFDLEKSLKEQGFVNEEGCNAIVSVLKLVFTEDLVYGSISKMFVITYVTEIDLQLHLMLQKNLKRYGLDEHKKNLLIAVIDSKLIEFLSRAVNGKELVKAYEAITKANTMVPKQIVS